MNIIEKSCFSVTSVCFFAPLADAFFCQSSHLEVCFFYVMSGVILSSSCYLFVLVGKVISGMPKDKVVIPVFHLALIFMK
jgi:hypothetical protein